jgi:hypothetical protein
LIANCSMLSRPNSTSNARRPPPPAATPRPFSWVSSSMTVATG